MELERWMRNSNNHVRVDYHELWYGLSMHTIELLMAIV